MEAEHLVAEVRLEAERADVVAPTKLYVDPAFVVENQAILEYIEDERAVTANNCKLFIHDREREETFVNKDEKMPPAANDHATDNSC